MNRTERIEHLIGLTGLTNGKVRRDLPNITKHLIKKWNLNSPKNFDRKATTAELQGKAMELRLLLEYYYKSEDALGKLDWRKFKKLVVKDFGRDFSDAFNSPRRNKLDWVKNQFELKTSDRDFFNIWTVV